jgi:hypothetical protein
VTRRKQPAGSGMYDDARRAIAYNHKWLCDNQVGTPAVAAQLTEEPSEQFRKNCLIDPYTMARFGAPADEAPGSRCAVVRMLLLHWLAIEALDVRERRAIETRGTASSAFWDDNGTRHALPLLEQGVLGARVLLAEAQWRRDVIRGTGLGEINDTMVTHAREALSILTFLVNHARTVMEVDPPRTVSEYNAFRTEVAKYLYDLGFEYGEIEGLLGHERSSDPGAQARIRDRVRKACKGTPRHQ